jgi:hypothetical protein
MLSKYYSLLLIETFIVWLIGYKLDIKFLNYINPYYTSVILAFGYFLVEINNIFIRDKKFECSLQIVKLATHCIPLASLIYFNKLDHKYAFGTLIISLLIYFAYLKYINKSVYEVYFVDHHPESWIDFKKQCLKDKDINTPACNLII